MEREILNRVIEAEREIQECLEREKAEARDWLEKVKKEAEEELLRQKTKEEESFGGAVENARIDAARKAAAVIEAEREKAARVRGIDDGFLREIIMKQLPKIIPDQ